MLHYDTDTVYFDNLLGAYIDGDDLIPIRFGLKHSKSGATTLYVVVDQNKVALENLDEKNDQGHQDASPTKEESNSLRRSVTYSISQLSQKKNPSLSTWISYGAPSGTRPGPMKHCQLGDLPYNQMKKPRPDQILDPSGKL